MERKSIVAVILFSIFTGGLYSIYWVGQQGNAARRQLGQPPFGALLGWTWATAILTVLTMVVWFVAYFGLIFAGGESVGVVVFFFASYAVLVMCGIAWTVLWLVLSIKALTSVQQALQARGASNTLEPMFMLIMLAFSMWSIIHLAITQNDINKLFEQRPY